MAFPHFSKIHVPSFPHVFLCSKKKKGPSLVPRIHYLLSWDTAFVDAVSPSGMPFCYALLCSFIPIWKTVPIQTLLGHYLIWEVSATSLFVMWLVIEPYKQYVLYLLTCHYTHQTCGPYRQDAGPGGHCNPTRCHALALAYQLLSIPAAQKEFMEMN